MVLAARLSHMGYSVARQRAIDVEFEGLQFPASFRIDLLVDERLLVEIKSVERLNAVHSKQMLTYLRLTRQPAARQRSPTPLRLCANNLKEQSCSTFQE